MVVCKDTILFLQMQTFSLYFLCRGWKTIPPIVPYTANYFRHIRPTQAHAVGRQQRQDISYIGNRSLYVRCNTYQGRIRSFLNNSV